MKKTINGSYQDHYQVKNTWDELIEAGVPRERIYIDEDAKVIKVIVASEAEPEIREIFDRHKLQ